MWAPQKAPQVLLVALDSPEAAQGQGVPQLPQGQKVFSLSCALDICYWLVSSTHTNPWFSPCRSPGC